MSELVPFLVDADHTTPILISGATASGKSALAVALARVFNGIVINADSMQVYAELPILTAQPSSLERAGVPHGLYGHVAAHDAYSTGRYLADMARLLVESLEARRRPIIIGGTGLYFKALLEGLSPVPPIPPSIRLAWRQRAVQLDAASLHADLQARDPEMAARLHPADRQRVTRALEVIEATGISLGTWQSKAGAPLIDAATAVRLVVERPRDELHARCDRRFDQMMAAGVLDEVRALAALRLSPELPAMRALGVRPLIAHLEGVMTRDAAIAQAKLETRQYVKRQETWLKGQMADWQRVDADAYAAAHSAAKSRN